MRILCIESTCDETAAAVVTERLEVLGSVVASQDDLHRRFGGVVPEIASRAHLERILPVIDETLRRSGIAIGDLDAVAVANTPGLAGSLLVGLVAAKTLCVALGLPLIAINHLQAHIYACRIASGEEVFPCVGLIVSGGHSSLYRCRGPLDFELLGATIDDAAGEAFDKVAAMLGLPYPGGPSIQRAAQSGNPRAHALPRSHVVRVPLRALARAPGDTVVIPAIGAVCRGGSVTSSRDITSCWESSSDPGRAPVECTAAIIAVAGRDVNGSRASAP